MINPFVATGMIPEQYFCDRKEESERLIRGFSNNSNIVLMSPRRVGKTQLLQHCFSKKIIADRYIIVFIDILKTSTLREFTYELGRAVFNQMASRGQKMARYVVSSMRSLTGNVSFDIATGMPKFGISIGEIQNPEYSLEEIFQTIAKSNKKIIIAIDEFQQIVNYKEKNIEALLRTHIQQLQDVSFVFAGSERHLLEEMFLDSARPFYNSADIMNLDVIPFDKYADFVASHFNNNAKLIDRQCIEYVYNTFKGNTYYNQKTFREAFSLTDANEECSLQKLNHIICQMVDDADRTYSETMSRLSLPMKELLYAVAREDMARNITSSEFIKKYKLKSASSVQNSVKKLIAYGFVTSEKGSYFISDQLFNIWLKR